MSDLRARVLAAQPTKAAHAEWEKLVTRHELKATDYVPAALADVRAEITRLVEAGESVPDDIAIPVLDARHKSEASVLRREILTALRQESKDMLPSIPSTETDAALAILRTELDELMSEVRTLAPKLKGIDSPEDALRAGADASKAYARMLELAPQYQEIRDLQDDVFFISDSDTRGDLKRYRDVGYFADSLEVLPQWHKRRADAYAQSTLRDVDHAAWLNAGAEKLPSSPAAAAARAGAWAAAAYPDEDHVGHLIWAATSARAWVPSLKEYAEAAAAAFTACTPISEAKNLDHPNKQVTALARYRAITNGQSPAVSKPAAAPGSLAMADGAKGRYRLPEKLRATWPNGPSSAARTRPVLGGWSDRRAPYIPTSQGGTA